MRLLLDTHTFIWWFAGNARLSASARQAIADEDNDVLISAASAWEIATKYRARRLPLAEDITGHIADENFEGLPITVRDPFDRLLIAQALGRNLVLVSIETLFDQYGVRRIW